MKLLLLVLAQFISELLFKSSTVVFQWCLWRSKPSLSFSLFLSFATNSSVTEKDLSGSTDLGLIIIKGMEQFFKVIWPLLCSVKKTHFLFNNLRSDLFLYWNSFVVFTLMDYTDSVLWFQMVDQTFGAWTTSFCITEHKLHFDASKLLNFFGY